MSATRAAFLPAITVSPYNKSMTVNGTSRSLTVGTTYDTLRGLLDALKTLFSADAADFSVSLSPTTGLVVIASTGILSISFDDSDLRDILGYTSSSYAGDFDYTAESQPPYAFFPTLPIAYDSGWEDDITRIHSVNDDGIYATRHVASHATREIEIQYLRDERDRYHDLMRYLLRGLPVAYYADRTATSS